MVQTIPELIASQACLAAMSSSRSDSVTHAVRPCMRPSVRACVHHILFLAYLPCFSVLRFRTETLSCEMD